MESVPSVDTKETDHSNDRVEVRKQKKKRTLRNRVVKLELSNDVERAVRKTAKVLYDMTDGDINIEAKGAEVQLKPAKDSSKWVQSDSLFNDAKKAYDSILKPFLEEPQVYKLESTRHK